MAMPNTELLRNVLQEIEWDTYHWDPASIVRRCTETLHGGEEFEIAYWGIEGHAIALAHPKALWHWQPDPEHEGGEFAVLVSVTGSRKKPGRNASYIARQLLGLDRAQADRLFGVQTIEDLRRIVAELCEGAAW